MSVDKKVIILSILLMILIFVLSSMPVDKIICKVKPKLDTLIFIRTQIKNLLHIHISFSMIQNFLHVPFFALLAFLWMKFFSVRKLAFKKAFVYTFLITAIFALFQEFSQAFIPDRDASYIDLFLNVTGCLGGVAIYRLFGVNETMS